MRKSCIHMHTHTHMKCREIIMIMFPNQVLNQVTPDPKGANCEAAMKNNAKNRSQDFLPSETLLVILWSDV